MHQEKENIHYYNTGGWVDERLTYVTIDPTGVRIHEYRAQAGEPDSAEDQGEQDSTVLDDLNDELVQPHGAEYENIER